MKDYMYKDNIDKFPVAMAYVPGICDNLEEGYCAGTIFPELDKPFTGRRCCKS